jgi:ectoine hydroxylase-related dioxygenase (phytanoyl-CoA dioxygenase family)
MERESNTITGFCQDDAPMVMSDTFRQQVLPTLDCRAEADWLPLVLDALRYQGVAVVANALTPLQCQVFKDKMHTVQSAIIADIGADTLQRAGETGVLRLMMQYDSSFLQLLESPELLAIVDATVSETAILHLQNGFILPPQPQNTSMDLFQFRFHRDFPRILNGAVMSLNIMIALDAFTETNGATWVVPGTHQNEAWPCEAYLNRYALPVTCPAGSLLVFDSTLAHAAGQNHSDQSRLAINHQFTRSYLKQQIDYVRALGETELLKYPPRTQQLLGYYTRVVKSLPEYYQPEETRLYRKGQG